MLNRASESDPASHSRGHNAAIELTVFTKIGGPLTKKIMLIADKVVSDGSACTMARGHAKRVTLGHIGELAELIEILTSSQAIALGSPRDDLPDEINILTKRKLAAAPIKDTVARTAENFRLPARSCRAGGVRLRHEGNAASGGVAAQGHRRLLGRDGGGGAGADDSGASDAAVDQRRTLAHRHRREVSRLRRPARLHHDQGRHRCGAVPEDAARALLARRLWLDECRRRGPAAGAFDHRPHGRRGRKAGVRSPAGGRAAARPGCSGAEADGGRW